MMVLHQSILLPPPKQPSLYPGMRFAHLLSSSPLNPSLLLVVGSVLELCLYSMYVCLCENYIENSFSGYVLAVMVYFLCCIARHR